MICRSSEAPTATRNCNKDVEKFKQIYPDISCFCEGDAIYRIQRDIEKTHRSYTALDTMIISPPEILSRLDEDGSRRTDNDLADVLSGTGIPREKAEFLVAAKNGAEKRERFALVLKVLLIHLCGNTDAISGGRLLEDLPFKVE